MNKIISRSTSFAIGLCILFTFSPNASAAHNFYTEENTVKKILDNGMTVIIHEIHKAPIVAIDIIAKTGSATEARFSGSGISHLAEHMLFKDSGKKEEKSKKERIKSLGGYINGFTSQDYTGYTVTTGSEYALEGLNTLKSIVASPSFDALELKKEKEVIINEIRKSEDDPARVAMDLSWALVFKEHPYKYPIMGYRDLFARLGKKELEEYYSERYSPHNMILVVSGDIKKEFLLKEIERIFGSLERNLVPTSPNISEPPQLGRRHRVEYRPCSLSHVVLSYKSASINETALYPLDLLAMLLGEGESSILVKELRDKKKLVYYIACRNYTLRDAGLFYIYFVTDSSKVNDAVAAVLEELEKVKNSEINDADLKKAKRMADAGLLSGLETAEGRAYDLSTSEMIANNYNFSPIYMDRLFNIQPVDIKSAAKTYLKDNLLSTVYILPEKEKETTLSQETAEPFRRKIAKEVMPNGLRLLVCEDHSMPLCAISALFLGGVRSEDSTNNSVSYLLSKLLLDGTAARSEEEIKWAIESSGGSIETISGNNSSGIVLNLLRDDWKSGIEIISDIIMNSRFGDEKVEKEKNLTLAAIKERDDSIIKAGLLLFKQNFFGKHPYRFDPLGTKENVHDISKADIIRHYEKLCVPGNMILAVSGDINTDDVIAELKKRFAPFEEMKPGLPKPPFAKNLTEQKEVSESMEREQSLVIVGFPSVQLTDNDKYVFETIDSIMSGLNGRMFNNIRDKLGTAYMIGSSFMPGLEPGCYIFYALTSRENIEPIKSAILKEIKELKEKTVPEEEINVAKRHLISSHMSELQRNEDFAVKISLDELYGLGYDNFESYSANINNVTAGHIKRVANQYFNLKNPLIVVIYGNAAEENVL